LKALRDRARQAFRDHLERNPYPGRGLVVGREQADRAWLQVYWIMGRSGNSRNRIFVAEGGSLRTAPFDPAALEDPSLVIYDAMLEVGAAYVVSNGDQTRTVCDALARGGSFEAALATREREPDAPNYTPRISALLDLRGGAPALALSWLKASPADPGRTDRATFRPAPPPPALGLALTTYRGDGNPLPPFEGEPLWLPLEGSAAEVLDAYWSALDAANRVALAVKRIPDGGKSEILLRNRHA
jgi:IMP cyclohydrolase